MNERLQFPRITRITSPLSNGKNYLLFPLYLNIYPSLPCREKHVVLSVTSCSSNPGNPGEPGRERRS